MGRFITFDIDGIKSGYTCTRITITIDSIRAIYSGGGDKDKYASVEFIDSSGRRVHLFTKSTHKEIEEVLGHA